MSFLNHPVLTRLLRVTTGGSIEPSTLSAPATADTARGHGTGGSISHADTPYRRWRLPAQQRDGRR